MVYILYPLLYYDMYMIVGDMYERVYDMYMTLRIGV